MLPRLRRWDVVPSAPCDGAHVACGELVPRVLESVGKCIRVVSKLLDDFLVLVFAVKLEGDIAGKHHNVLRARAICCWRHGGGRPVDPPLVVASRAHVHLPLVSDEQLEVDVVKLGGLGGPRSFKPTSIRVSPSAFIAPTATQTWPWIARVFQG